MVESEAKELSEDQMLGAVLYGHAQQQVVIDAINEFAKEVGVQKPIRCPCCQRICKPPYKINFAAAISRSIYHQRKKPTVILALMK